MRIAFIAPFGLQPKGTVSARMMPLAEALAERGHMVRVVIPPWDDPSAPRRGESRIIPAQAVAGQGAGVHIVTLPLSKRTPNAVAFTYGLVKEALRPSGHRSPVTGHASLATFKPEIIHVFKPVGYSGMSALVLQALRVPWVLDVDDWEGPGGWADVNSYSPAQKLAITLMDAMLPRMALRVTAASRTLEARCWVFGVPRKQVSYMPNGVWSEKYAGWAQHPEAARSDRPTLLLYTRFDTFPYQWALEILKQMLDDHPTARLLVVGNGFFGEEEKLKVEAESAGLAQSITILGRVPEVDLPAHLSQADVALYPMQDTLINRAKSPVKLLELMVMGLPIVAHKVGEVSEFLGHSGIEVEPGDLHEMAQAASTLLSKPEDRSRLGTLAQRRVWERFNWERLSEVAEQRYRSVL